ncbi:MAG: Rpn family recombination-promoting nuclease/putative transposase [Ruminococcus sp.]|jgi:hypothetical protein|nr:Rpn family recombination-promoting nuclease/putative transposase [Ruminococcus sp.]
MIDIPKILPFKDDYVFKALLTRYDSGIIRNSMISAFTGLKIVSSEVVENEPAIDSFAYEKLVRFDVNCVTDDGTRIEIEMQAHSMPNDNSADKFIHRFCYRDGETLLSDYCSIIYVELPKIKKSLEKPFDEMTDDERWAVFVEYVDDSKFEAKVREFETRKEFREAMENLSRISKSDQDRARYNLILKNKMDRATEIHLAEKKGKAEALIEVAMDFLRNGFTPADVAKGVKLPLADIEALQKNL